MNNKQDIFPCSLFDNFKSKFYHKPQYHDKNVAVYISFRNNEKKVTFKLQR